MRYKFCTFVLFFFFLLFFFVFFDWTENGFGERRFSVNENSNGNGNGNGNRNTGANMTRLVVGATRGPIRARRKAKTKAEARLKITTTKGKRGGKKQSYTRQDYKKIQEKMKLKIESTISGAVEGDLKEMNILQQFDYIWRNVMSKDEKQEFTKQVLVEINSNIPNGQRKRNYDGIKQILAKIRLSSNFSAYKKYFVENDDENDMSSDNEPPRKRRRRIFGSQSNSNSNCNDNQESEDDSDENESGIYDSDEGEIDEDDEDDGDDEDADDEETESESENELLNFNGNDDNRPRYTDSDNKIFFDALIEMEKECVKSYPQEYENPDIERLRAEDRFKQLHTMFKQEKDEKDSALDSIVIGFSNTRTKAAIKEKLRRMFTQKRKNDSLYAYLMQKL